MVLSPSGNPDFLISLLESCKEIQEHYINDQPWLHSTNIKRSDERKWFHTKKTRCKYPTETIRYANDLPFLTNSPPKLNLCCIAENINADKTEFMCFKQDGVILTLSGKSLKLADQFNIPQHSYLIYRKQF